MKIIRKEIIFGLTQERAQEKLEDFIKNCLLVHEEVVNRDKNYVKTNLRMIYAIECGIPTKGTRCDVAHVDQDISIRYLHECVMPIVLNSYGESGHIKYY